MRFQRVEVAGRAAEVTISSEQIGTATGIGKSAAYRAVRTAFDLGYLSNNESRPVEAFQARCEARCRRSGRFTAPGPEDQRHHRRRRAVMCPRAPMPAARPSFHSFRFVSNHSETIKLLKT